MADNEGFREWLAMLNPKFQLKHRKSLSSLLKQIAAAAICERLFKRAKHIGTTDRMARLLEETFEMLIMAQYNIVRHGGVEAIEVRKRSIRIL